ncbi:hypothetical protein PROFUN_01378 [Planoprotostelium fungivorum]|uniref:Splicing factor 3A subunit 1 n=1 Tax=Planoprotostelium fungivorum TaxID=1890364 RepID=A0A2P6NT41_9EUKA|nr:hypothetical protein PROFUN_01378 [Planoprotostelium fungivorum]
MEVEPPLEIKNFVDTTAHFVAKFGLPFHNKVAENEKNNPSFSFLRPTDPFYPFYQTRIKFFEAQLASGNAAPTSAAPAQGAPAPAAPKVVAEPVEVAEAAPRRAMNSLPQRMINVNNRVKTGELEIPNLSSYFILEPPEPLTAMEFDIMKLTAQFIARNGHKFHNGLLEREHRNPQFDFLKPHSPLNPFFQRQLIECYSKVIHPPRNITSMLKDQYPDRQDLLDRLIARYQTDKEIAERERIEKEKEDDSVTSIDWHDFTVVYTIDFQDEAPAPIVPEIPMNIPIPVPEEDIAMDTEDMEVEDEPVRRPTEIRLRKDYVKGGVVSSGPKYQVCPKCGKDIAVEDMDEHMRIELMDPKTRQNRDIYESRNRGGANFLAGDDEISRNLQQFASKRVDIFGDNQNVSLPEREEKTDKVIWDGHSSSINSTTAQAYHRGLANPDPPVLAPPPLNSAGPGLPQPPSLYTHPAPPVIHPGPMGGPMGNPMGYPGAMGNPMGGMGLSYGGMGRPLEGPSHEPTAKAARLDDSVLSEADFLKQYPAGKSYSVTVKVPDEDNSKTGWKLQGQTIQVTILPTETVQQLKEKISKEVGIPANKQKLQSGAAHLADQKSLASYNVSPSSSLDLRVKARGGKKG